MQVSKLQQTQASHHIMVARVEAYTNTCRLSCPMGSQKISELDEKSRKWLTARGMRTNSPDDTVFTRANGMSNSGVVRVRLVDTCSLKHSRRCDDEMKPLNTLHKNRTSHCVRRACKCDTWYADSRSEYARDAPS